MSVIVLTPGLNLDMVLEPSYISLLPIFFAGLTSLTGRILLPEGTISKLWINLRRSSWTEAEPNVVADKIKWSQDDLLRLIHSSKIVPSVSRMLPVNDVKPAIKNWKERNRSTKALIPCGNWTRVLEQLHSQKLPITHANYTQRRLNMEQNTNLYWISVK